MTIEIFFTVLFVALILEHIFNTNLHNKIVLVLKLFSDFKIEAENEIYKLKNRIDKLENQQYMPQKYYSENIY